MRVMEEEVHVLTRAREASGQLTDVVIAGHAGAIVEWRRSDASTGLRRFRRPWN